MSTRETSRCLGPERRRYRRPSSARHLKDYMLRVSRQLQTSNYILHYKIGRNAAAIGNRSIVRPNKSATPSLTLNFLLSVAEAPHRTAHQCLNGVRAFGFVPVWLRFFVKSGERTPCVRTPAPQLLKSSQTFFPPRWQGRDQTRCGRWVGFLPPRKCRVVPKELGQPLPSRCTQTSPDSTPLTTKKEKKRTPSLSPDPDMQISSKNISLRADCKLLNWTRSTNEHEALIYKHQQARFNLEFSGEDYDGGDLPHIV